jgi:hypothetical protein
LIDKGLIDRDQAEGDRGQADEKGEVSMSILRRNHHSRLDKAARQSQSSTSGLTVK